MPECGFRDSENPYLWATSIDSSNSRLWEIPTTIHRPSEYFAHYYAKYAGRRSLWSNSLRRVYAKLGGLLPLRPDPTVSNDALSRIVNSAIRRNVSVINLTLHSSELEFGCSPFSRNTEDTRAVWDRLESVFSLVRTQNMLACRLSDVPRLLTKHQ